MLPRHTWQAMSSHVLYVAGVFLLLLLLPWLHGNLVRPALLEKDLERWGLPEDLPAVATGLTELHLPDGVDDFRWIPGNVKRLHLGAIPANSIELPRGLEELYAPRAALQSLEGLPPDLRVLDVEESPLSPGEQLPAGLWSLTTNGVGFSNLAALPPNLRELVLRKLVVGNAEDGIEVSGLPRSLRTLRLEGVQTRSLAGLPPGLQELELNKTAVAWIRPWPADLRTLLLYNNLAFRLDEVGPLPRLVTHFEYVSEGDLLDCASLTDSLHTLSLDPGCKGRLDGLPQLRSFARATPSMITRFQSTEGGGEGATPEEDEEEKRVLLPSLDSLQHLGLMPSEGAAELEAKDLRPLAHLPLESLELMFYRGEDLASVPIAARRLVLQYYCLEHLAGLPPNVRSLVLRLPRLACPSPEVEAVDENELPAAPLADADGREPADGWGPLEELVFPWSPWAEVPEVLSRLIRLDLSDSDVRTLPTSMARLEELALSGTCVAELPGELPSLVMLDISGTRIDHTGDVPATVRELTIHRDQIHRIGNHLTELEVLRIVDWAGPPASRCGPERRR